MAPTDVRDVFQLVGTSLEGRFSVDRAVAEGGFGVVYHARQAALERSVALKVLKTPARYDEPTRQQFLSSFATEARTIARITHPNIVLVYDFGVSGMPSGERAAWMALEWLTGMTLDDDLASRRGRGGRTPSECLKLVRPVLSALAVVHAAGIAHRDLKPANIMLTAGGGGTPKLLDFGIAKIMDAGEAVGTGQTESRANQIAYSPAYASPEQVSRRRTGPWTDVHAMALILSEMLTDRPPLEADLEAMLYQQVFDPIRPSPAKFGVQVGAWEPVLCRALALSPPERYRNASELLKALEATVPNLEDPAFADTALQDAPLATRDPHPGTRASVSEGAPGVRKKPFLSIAIAGAIALALATGLVWRAAFPTRVGFLILDTSPQSFVSEGDTALGETPLNIALPAGTHTLTLDAPAPAGHSTYAVVIKAGEAVTRYVPLGGPSDGRQQVQEVREGPCNPPFSYDAQGLKHFKPECL